MFLEIDYNNKPKKPKIYLAKPNKDVISIIKSAYDINVNFKLGNVYELTFKISNLEEYKNIIKYRYLIKFEINNQSEWFIIKTPNKSTDSSSDKFEIDCKSLMYELNDKYLTSFIETSVNAYQILSEILTETSWTVDYINPEFNNTYRSFEYNNTTKLEGIYDVAKTFSGVIIPNSELRKISLYKPSEIGDNKGFRVKYGKYLEGLNDGLDTDSIVTRLMCYGNDNLSIQRVNLTGENYIEDFSYFLYPFQRDIDRNVIQNSDYMSDNLCHAILDYFELLDVSQSTYDGLLSTLSLKQSNLSTAKSELSNLNIELQIILDSLNIAYETNNTSQISSLTTQRNSKMTEITNKKSEISSLNNDVNNINIQIIVLQNSLSKSNNFTPQELEELNYYIIESEFRDDNYIDEDDLYNAGLEYLSKTNEPSKILTINITNPLACIEHQFDWDKIVLGDNIYVEHEKLGVDYVSKIMEINYNFEREDISIVVGEVNQIEKDTDKFIKMLYKSARTNNLVEAKKFNWDNVTTDFNTRNNRNRTIPANPIIATDGSALDKITNKDGSVNIRFLWEYDGVGDEYDIDGFIVYANSLTNNYSYVCGSSTAREQTIDLPSNKRAYILYGVPADQWYTFGVQAYRVVDSNITTDGSGVLVSEIVQPTKVDENPYQPNTEVDFIGTFNGNTTEQLKRTGSTVIVSSASTSKNPDRADYIVPAGADAQATIQSAINSLPSTGGEVVVLDGVYDISSEILINKSNVSIMGNGSATVFKRKNTPNLILTNLITGVFTENISIKNIKFQSTTLGNIAVLLYGIGAKSKGNLVEGCFFENFRYSVEFDNTESSNISNNNIFCPSTSLAIGASEVSSIHLSNSAYCIVSDNYIKGYLYNISNVQINSGINLHQSFQNKITNNTITGFKLSNISYSNLGGIISSQNCPSNILNNNNIYDCTNGIQLQPGTIDFTIVGNVIQSCEFGVRIWGSNNKIDSNQILTITGGQGIDLISGNANLIQNNNFTHTGSGSVGVFIQGGVTNTMVLNNSFVGYAIGFSDTGTGTVVNFATGTNWNRGA